MIKIDQNCCIPQAFKGKSIPVCFSANNSYVPQTAVMIKSVIENASDDKNYDFIILSTDIDEKNERILLSFIGDKKNISIRIYDISSMLDDVTFFTDSIYTPTTYSKEAYFRLFIPFAMSDYDKVVYFDGDMTAASDISPIMDIDMTNYIAAATRDYCGIAACYDTGSDRLEYRKEIGIKVPDDYFISSMVVVNIQKFREMYSLDDLKKMISSRNWRQHDQDIFNVLCQDALLIVGAEWSFFEEFDYSLQWLPDNLKDELLSAQKKAIVVHYAGANKAWMDDNSELTAHFWKHASQTPYFEEFYKKIPNDKVIYKYHIFRNILNWDIDYYYTDEDIILSSGHMYIGSVGELKICVEFLDIKNDVATFEGWFEAINFLGDLKLFAKINGNGVITENSVTYREYGTRSSVKKIRSFSVSICLNSSERESIVDFGLTYDDIHFIRPKYISVEQFAPLNEHPRSFYSRNGYILTKQYGTNFKFEPHSRKKVLKYNKDLCRYLFAKKDKYFKKMAGFRWLYYLTKTLYRNKNIWLISDTSINVDAKTLQFFEYMKTQKHIDAYLVVSSNCERLDELKKLGKVVVAQSKKHKFLFFHSKVVIASEYYAPFFMPAYDRANEIRDIIANKKFVYWNKKEEDLSYNVRPYYNVSKFIFENRTVYSQMLNADNGYSAEHLCLINDDLVGRWRCQAMLQEIEGKKHECK